MKKFPTFAAILLILGIVWFLNDLHILTIEIPWIPLILIIIAVGIIVERYYK